MRATESIYDLSARKDPAFLPWWREAWCLWRRAPNYDVVVTMGIRTSMAFGLICLATGRKSKQIMCEIFIDAPRYGIGWALKNWLYGLLARRSLGVLTNSSAEIDSISRRFRLAPSKIRFVPLNSTVGAPHIESEDDGYVIAAGRTLRDYPTLLDAARLLPDISFRIVCGASDLIGAEIPGNVSVIREAPRERYLEELRKSRIVAIPLLPTERATGQVVLLDAMAMGKPVVTTRVPGVLDYVEPEKNGVLIDPRDAGPLAEAIRRLWNDPSERKRLGQAAYQTVSERATIEGHARAKLAAIRELAGI